ncbi:hypothetical protein X975_23587, partial [Stegodyphus mimosarum]
MIMTDDSCLLRTALHSTRKNTRLLLCQFHVLQAVWRWLCSSNNDIDKNHRKYMMNCVKQLMYAVDTESFGSIKRNIFRGINILMYSQFCNYL